jgi:hypothetical protein
MVPLIGNPIHTGLSVPNRSPVMKVDHVNSRTLKSFGRVAIAAAIIAASVSYSTASFANPGSAKQQMACMGDVMRLCLTSIGSDQAIISCMTQNKDRLTKRCKATLPPI